MFLRMTYHAQSIFWTKTWGEFSQKKKKNTVGNIWDGTIYEQWTFYSDVMSFDQIEEPNFFFTQIGSPLLFN